MKINREINGAFVLSSGKNMGIFKGVGFSGEIGRFFKLENYRGYAWTAHGRFPTNTVGWWGGAHPFGLLDWSVVHNGEISSYGINKRYLENFGYHCALFTDTEVMTYLIDLLARKHGFGFDIIGRILAAPFWDEIERLPENQRELCKALRITYGSALVNGPFATIIGRSGAIIGINDRIKLRPLVAARKGSMLYLSSEESGIREVCQSPDEVWMPEAGEPVIGRLEGAHG
jgi:glutamate synthase domain-containing protein 1